MQNYQKQVSEQISANFQRCNDLHNRQMEIKGNIRVFCRTRPILQCEQDAVQKRLEPNYMPKSAQSK